jgi:hypothetical protein
MVRWKHSVPRETTFVPIRGSKIIGRGESYAFGAAWRLRRLREREWARLKIEFQIEFQTQQQGNIE